MPRRIRRGTGHLIFHAFNRGVENAVLFRDSLDFEAFLHILTEAAERFPMLLPAYVLMPTHFHLVLWPEVDRCLSAYMKWVTGTHAQRWRRMHETVGRGAVYQGRFKAIAVQDDWHFWTMCRYVERNPVRAKLVDRAEEWRWGSAWAGPASPDRPPLSAWPCPRPTDWLEILNAPERPRTLAAVRRSITIGLHYATPSWRRQMSERLGWRSGFRLRGAPVRTAVDPEEADDDDGSVSEPIGNT